MVDLANQNNFTIKIDGFDNSGFQVLSFEGIEALNTPYAFVINLINKHIRFDFTQLLNQSAFLTLDPSGNGIHGIISAVKRGAVGLYYAHYQVLLTPRFKQLEQRTNQRIFQKKTSAQIITQLLTEHGIFEGLQHEFRLSPTPLIEREYCVQYAENDADFIQRLCEEDGLSYHFEHTATNHLMVFGDSQPIFPRLPTPLSYVPHSAMLADEPTINTFNLSLKTASSKASVRDYNFKQAKVIEGISQARRSTKAGTSEPLALEHYSYNGRFTNSKQGKQRSSVKVQCLQANHVLATGASDSPSLRSGYFLTVDDHPSLDSKDPWLLNSILHQGAQPQVLEAFGDNQTPIPLTNQLLRYYAYPCELELTTSDFKQGYRNVFNALPRDVIYRPPYHHPKPTILGTQTAVVVGASDEEIYCDEYGRIKVQFHWDREGHYNEHSSCWIRVTSSWAHNGYGAVVIPRVGMEVLVNFLEGDPDQPVITGCLHNGKNQLPYELPAHNTQSVFKTSSSKGGVGSNELRIDDKKGEEQLFIQAQKDFAQLTKNNHTVQIDNNSHLSVGNEHSLVVKNTSYTHNQAEEHHQTDSDRKTQVLGSDYTSTQGASHSKIGTVLTVQAGQEIHLKAGNNLVIDGGMSLTLKAGGQHIVLRPDGIFTTPMRLGGSPIAGTQAEPLSPLIKNSAVAQVTSPERQEAGSRYNLRFRFVDDNGIAYAQHKYLVYLPEGNTVTGVTNEQGYTKSYYFANPEQITAHLVRETKNQPDKKYNLRFRFVDDQDKPYAKQEYKVFLPEGKTTTGITDEQGYSASYYFATPEKVTAHLKTR